MRRASDIPATALLLLPGAACAYLSFNAGGFFPNTVAFVAIIAAAALIIRTGVARAPFEGLSGPVLLAAGALVLFAAWTLLSAVWSDAPSRALIEFDRALLYALVLVLFGSVPRTPASLQWLVRGLAGSIAVVGTVALITRVLPHVWPTSAALANNRLSYPLTYWNALGLLVGLGIVFCAYLTTSLREPRTVRVLAAAAMPVLAATLLFTFSRGAIAATIVGVVAYILLGRPHGLITGLLAVAPPTTIALVAAYDADLLATTSPTTSAAVAQGHHVAAVVGVCIALAALLRAVLLVVDTRLAGWRPPRLRRPLLASGATLAVVTGIGIALALGAPGSLDAQYHRFVHGTSVGKTSDFRSRLTDPGNNGRIDQWDVALDAFGKRKLDGSGAATYALAWAKDRPYASTVIDAHSLYVEVLGELGLVGLALLLVALGTIIGGLAVRCRGRHRSVHAALFAAALAWAVHAGVDWDWEMPAVTLWLFAAGGLVLAAPAREEGRSAPSGTLARTLVALGSLALAVIPALLLISQSHIDRSADAYRAGNCTAAISSAGSAISVLRFRPEPYEIRAYCEARQGHAAAAVRDMRRAISRDPDNWEYRYGLALVTGAAGQDPRPAVATAMRMNPLEPVIQDAEVRLETRNARTWKREARRLLRARELIR